MMFVIKEYKMNFNGEMIMYTAKTNNGTVHRVLDEYDGLCMTHETYVPGDMRATVNLIDESVFNETACIKLPLNSTKDFKGHCYNDYKSQLDDVKHVNLWVTYQPSSKPVGDEVFYGWIWVELEEPIDGVKMIPIIIFNGTYGVDVHPDFHKYFLRAFNKQERHHILGYLYRYGTHILNDAYWIMVRQHRDVEDKDYEHTQMDAVFFKDSDVPKRIDMGPGKSLKGTHWQYVIDGYKDWKKRNKEN